MNRTTSLRQPGLGGARTARGPVRVFASATATDEKALKRQAKEKAGLEAFAASVGGKPTVELAARTIKEAMRTKATPPPIVTGAARFLEDQKLPVDPSLVKGNYALIFSTVTPIEQWSYIPVDEYIQITDDKISMYSLIGPLKTSFSGDFKWRGADSTTMDFTMPRMEMFLFGNKLQDKMREQKERFYTYFYADEQLVGVRSSAGGITILYKP